MRIQKVTTFTALVVLCSVIAVSSVFAQSKGQNTADPSQLNVIIHHFPPPMDFVGFPFVSVVLDESTPDWARMLYQQDPNLWEIKYLHELWREAHPRTKNGHTRNYKKLMGYLAYNNAISEEGFIDLPTMEETTSNNARLKSLRKRTLANASKNRSTTNQTDWELIGPAAMLNLEGTLQNRHINIYSITQCLSNTDVLYCASEAGGTVFKTIDNGDNWFSVSDDLITNMGSRNIEVAPSNPDIVYLCTSNEILKTTVGGNTWNSVLSHTDANMNTLIIHPTNPDIVMAGGRRGIFKSTDGGASWSNPLSGRTIYDLRYKPGSTEVIYALVDNLVTKQTDFYKSIDSGETWTVKTTGWPSAASTANSGGQMTTSDGHDHIIFVFIGASWVGTSGKKKIKVLKSSDSGETWTLKVDTDNEAGINSGQGYYDWDIEMSDVDSNIVALGTQGSWISYDGFETSNSSLRKKWHGHSDIQEMIFNGDEIWVVNDGGITKYDDDQLYDFEVKSTGINAMSYWSFDQGWNKDVQIGTHYHNGTSGIHEDYLDLHGVSFGGAEPSFSLVGQPKAERIVSKGYGSVDGYYFPSDPSGDFKRFNYDLEPNMEGYDGSSVCTHPTHYDTHFAGKENRLMYSENFGVSWTTMYTFPESNEYVRTIEISRANTDVIYVATQKSGGGNLYKSVDGGKSFTSIPFPFEDDVFELFISVSHVDENEIYISGNNGNPEIYKSLDGGANWINLWMPSLNGYTARRVMHVSGTDGGVYMMGRYGIFYRNNTMPDWEPLLTGMPLNARFDYIKPFYRDNALRVATERGVYGAEFYDTPVLSKNLLQPSVQKKYTSCAKDTFFFDDFSVVAHAGATWSWSFPGATYVDDVNIRNPKVIYGNSGVYDVTMTIMKDGQSFSKTIEKMVEVENLCETVDPIADKSLVLDRASRDNAVIENINITTNTFTFTAWIKPTDELNSFQGIFSNGAWCAHCNDETLGLVIGYQGDRLHYRWPGTTSGWTNTTNLYPVLDEWQYVAFVMSPDKVTVYLNEEKWESNISHDPADITNLYLGLGHYSNYYKGEIEEVAMWNRSLSDSEIKEQMHLVKDPSTDPDLLAYYQFNGNDELAINKASNLPAILKRNATRTISSAPIGTGTSNTQYETVGNVNFTNTDFEVDFFDQNGVEVVASKINNIPFNLDGLGDGEITLAPEYWAIHRYGSGDFSADLTFKTSYNITAAEASNPCQFVLYKRGNESDKSWSYVSTALTVDDVNDKLTFTAELEEWAQFFIVKSTLPTIYANSPVVFNNTIVNTISDERSYELNGTNLNSNVNITAPANFEISLTSGTGFATALDIAPTAGKISTTIYVQYQPTENRLYEDQIVHTSAGAQDLTVEVFGEAISLDKFPGSALDLDGSNDYVDLGNPEALQIIGDLTIQFWAKPSNFSANRNLIGKAYGGEFALTQRTNGFLTFYHGSSGGNSGGYNQLSTTSPLDLNEWNQVTFVRDATAKKYYWYINGVLDNQDDYTATVKAGGNSVFIGEGYASGFAGLMDEVKFWNKALDIDQIREEMHLTLNGDEPGLVAYYQFNENDGEALDKINGLNGTFKNNATRSIATEPVGGGSSFTQSTPIGNVIFTNTNFSGNFETNTTDSVVASKIDLSPNDTQGLGAGESAADQQYWVINKFGGSGITGDLVFKLEESLTAAESASPATVKLYGRNMNSDEDWNLITQATAVDDVNSEITFDDVATYDQYLVARAPFPKITLSEMNLDFGDVDYNTAADEQSYTIIGNDLTADVNLVAPDGFQISLTAGSGFTDVLSIAPTSGNIPETTLFVKYEPAAPGNYLGAISHSSSGATTAHLQLQGNGLGPEIKVIGDYSQVSNAGSVNFGSTTVADAVEKKFTIENEGLGILNLTGTNPISISGTNATDFEVIGSPELAMDQGEYSNFTIRFTPSDSGLRTAIMTIENNDPNEGSYIVNLTGEAEGLPEIIVSTNALSSFENQLVGTSSDPASYTVEGIRLKEDIYISPYPNFEISLNSTSGFTNDFISLPPTNGVVAPTTIFVRFVPTGVNGYTGAIQNASLNATSEIIHLDASSSKKAETIPGNAISFDGVNDYVDINSDDIVVTNKFTVEFWAKFDGDLLDGNSVVYSLNATNKRVINIHLPKNGNIYFDAGGNSGYDRIQKSVTTDDLEGWHHWAFVKDATTGMMYIYRDGVLWKQGSGKNRTMDNIAKFNLGRGAGFYYEGEIEEFRIWNSARTQSEIRENIHLTQLTADENLLVYHQFNESNYLEVFNVKGKAHGTIINGAQRITSTRPLGAGFSNTKIEAAGVVEFTNTELSIDYNSQSAAEIVVSKINLSPNVLPEGLVRTFDSQYWAINRFGTGSFSGDLIMTLNEDLTALDEAHPEEILLYSRTSNADSEWLLRTAASSVDAASNTVTFSGVDHFSQFIVGSVNNGVVLPVDLTRFTAAQKDVNTVELAWETATEQLLKHYELEHSVDGINFSKFKTVRPENTNSDFDITYLADHNDPTAGNNYYRLKIVDLDGRFAYSGIRFVQFSDEIEISIFPNPVEKGTGVTIYNPKLYEFEFKLYNATGILINSFLMKDEASHYLKIEDLPSGIYFYSIEGEGKLQSGKLDIQQ